MHEIRMPDGSSIREFVNAQGIVYAVAWSTRLKPDFTQMLGRHAADFDAGVSAQSQKAGTATQRRGGSRRPRRALRWQARGIRRQGVAEIAAAAGHEIRCGTLRR